MIGRTVVYYVSGHGFGHARRSAEVVRRLLAMREDVRLIVRTSAPASIFADAASPRLGVQRAEIDPGCVEKSLLEIDGRATLDAAKHFVRQSEKLIAQEADFVRQSGAALVVSDIAFLAGAVARSAGVPSVGISNFTWDWIFEPFIRDESDRALVEQIRSAYAEMNELIRLPYGGVASFRRTIDVPLIASGSEKESKDVLAAAGIESKDDRPRILIAARGAISPQMIHDAAASAPQCLFIVPYELNTDQKNVRSIPASNSVTFADLLSVSALAISKLGYGIVADCLAARVGLLWPRRVGFREDTVTEFEARRYIRMRELPNEDFYAGRWGDHVRELLDQNIPREVADTSGALRCAELLDRALAAS
jgi:L-arabinokinase